MENEKISVIVPVYKVEPYLRKCLDSIVNQTYRNLEIILVDDGSPDNCGMICDEYAERDNRIRVIHQENRGVSSARNEGLKIASGDWIGWVDSDDWIEPDMFAYLIENVERYQTDIAVCSRCEHYKTHQQFRGWKEKQVLETEGALKYLLENDLMQNYLWDKLWKRSIFDGITFPVGRTYEDIAVMHLLFERANKVICLPEVKYHYLQRQGSIIGDISLENRLNYYFASIRRYEDMKEKWSKFQLLLEAQCMVSAIGIWCGYYANRRDVRKRFYSQLKEISEFGKKHLPSAIRYANLGLTGKAVLFLIPYPYWWSFAISRFFGIIYKAKHERNL